MTEVLLPHELSRAAEWLLANEIVAFPTETVYGLGAPIFRPQTIEKIFHVKGRPTDNPLIAHISDLAQVEEIAVEVPAAFYRLAEAFFPGPLTFVLKRHPKVPGIVSGGLPTIAIRMPKHPLALQLIEMVAQPLVAPSANLSGKPSATSISHVLEDFKGKIAAVIDGGSCDIGIESTVISLLFPDEPLLFRPGAISKEQLEAVLQRRVAIFSCEKHEQKAMVSPGMKYRHYAPCAKVRLFYSEQEVLSHVRANPHAKRMILSSAVDFLFLPKEIGRYVLSRKTLYALLRLADEKCIAEVLILCDAPILCDQALMNRLLRAAEEK